MRRTFALLIALSLGHVLLISEQVQSKSGLPLLESFAFGAFARTQQVTAGIGDAIRGVWSRYFALRGVSLENEQLRREVLELQGKVQEQQAMLAEKHALEDALALQRRLALRTLAARVIAGSPSPESLTIMIDRGSADGVEADMAIIAAKGVVGRVINQPSQHAAQVQLLIGRLAGASVTIEPAGSGPTVERPSVGGFAMGGAGDPHLEYVPSAADVRIGDRVLTSGQEGFYPPGFVIGTVERTDRGDGTYRKVLVRPAVDFSHIDIVLVVLSKPAAKRLEGSGERSSPEERMTARPVEGRRPGPASRKR
jgi:rod shape-determining protein MreC